MVAIQFDDVTGLHTLQFDSLPAAIQALHDEKQAADIVVHFERHVHARGFHLHHAPARDVHGQRRHVIEVGVCQEPVGGAHEIPRLRTTV